jgi:hypothetical protein
MENGVTLAQQLGELSVKEEKEEKAEPAAQGEAELAPIKAELEKLRQLRREILFEKVKLLHPELDLCQAEEGFKELEKQVSSTCMASGLARRTAEELAKQTAALWESEEGITALSLIKKLKNGEKVSFVNTPDLHIPAAAQPPQKKDWKDKVKSGDAKERLSVFDDLFRE